MTDRPSPEQQLAEVIHRGTGWGCAGGCPFPDCCYASGDEESQAAAIVAAVNSGDIDPIVPEGKVVVDAPPKPHGDWCLCTSCRRLDDVHAELVELRALKAKVDGCELSFDASAHGQGWNDLLAWLRGTDP